MHTRARTHMDSGILHSYKKDEIVPFETTWMDPEGIMLSDISQPEKDKYHIWNIRKNPNEQSEKETN